MKLLLLRISVLMLVATCVSAEEPLSLSPNSLPIFYSVAGNNPRYRDASFKAQEAFFVQTGFTQNIDKMKGKVRDKTKKAQKTVAKEIDEHTSLSSKQVFFILGTGYAAGTKRVVKQQFRNPVFRSVRHVVSYDFKSNIIFTGFTIPFP